MFHLQSIIKSINKEMMTKEMNEFGKKSICKISIAVYNPVGGSKEPSCPGALRENTRQYGKVNETKMAASLSRQGRILSVSSVSFYSLVVSKILRLTIS